MKLAKVLMTELARRGIKKAYGVPGRENKFIFYNECINIQYITCRVEFNAGIMAEFTGRLTQTPQVCFATMGPGATNMVTTAASAMLNHSPLIIITAQLESDDRFYNYTHQCVCQKDIFQPVTKLSVELEKPEEIITLIAELFKIVMSEPMGPVHLSIPVDLLNCEIAYSKNEEEIETPAIKLLPNEYNKERLQEAYNLISASQQPVCLIGQEVVRTNSEQSVKEFCEMNNLPALFAANAKGILPHDHILNIGTTSPYMEGILNYPALRDIFNEVDLLICIGYQYVDDLLPKMWDYGRPKKILLISGNDTKAIEKKFKPDLKLLGSISEILKLLPKLYNRNKLLIDLSNLKSRIKQLYFSENIDRLVPIQIIRSINENLKDGYLITDIGYYRHHATLFTITNKPRRFFTDSGLSTFGSGLPSAMAAKLTYPDRRVILICGDGGFHSGSCDLETLHRLGINIIIILLNNSSFELIKLYQNNGCPIDNNTKILKFSNIDFSKLAEANGCKGVKIETLAELRTILSEYDDDVPLLIDVPFEYPENDRFKESF